jgi:nucleotide-binding universal stress UspA family protein
MVLRKSIFFKLKFTIMKNTFPIILAALDLSLQDNQILKVLKTVGELTASEKAYLLHVSPDFSVPENLESTYHQIFNSKMPVDERMREDILQRVEETWDKYPAFSYSVEVREGKPYQKLMHWLSIKDADLLIIGQKKLPRKSGLTAKRVARTAPTSVLIVPEKERSFKWILVPMDFSEHSKKALNMALAMQAKKPDISITALHIVEQPPADFYNQALVDSTFREALREAANKSFEKLFSTIPGAERIRLELIDNHYHNPGIHIQEFAKNGEYDLILMGAQGHSMLKSMLFGSVTEAVVEKNEDQHILILR